MSLSALQDPPQFPQAVVGRRVRIAYTDSHGEPSIRVIEALHIYRGRSGYTYLRAYCHLRQEERTFRLDRIRSWEQLDREEPGVSDGHTGEDKSGKAFPYPPANPLPQSPRSTRRPIRRRHPFRTLLLWSLFFLAARWLMSSGTAENILWRVGGALSGGTLSTCRYSGYPHESDPGKTPSAPLSVPAHPHKNVSWAPEARSISVQRSSYRGVEIVATPRGEARLYAAPGYAFSAASRRTLHLKINAVLFRQATGIVDQALEELYAGADTDRDGYLCWKEIKEFQRKLSLRYAYRHNTTALRPDEFLAQRGGDCEDWALMSCGLLRYWGWEGYVAAFFPPGGGGGHALCMVRWSRVPRGFEYYTVDQGLYAWDGAPVHPGYYVPIDYEAVGRSSTAVKRGWLPQEFYTPERIYRAAM